MDKLYLFINYVTHINYGLQAKCKNVILKRNDFNDMMVFRIDLKIIETILKNYKIFKSIVIA